MNTHIRHLVISVGTVVLAACGGGGGDGGGPVTPNQPVGPTLTEITSQNAPATTAGVLDAVLTTALLAGVSGTDLFLPTSVTSTGGIVGAGETVLKLIRLRGAAKQVIRILVPVGPFTDPCLVSGSVTFSGDVQNQDTLSEGDSITADFSNCDDGDGLILNGGFDFTFVSFSQSIIDCFVFGSCTGQDQLTIDAVFRDFRTTEGTVTVSVDGDQTLEIDTTTPPTSTTTVFGNSLTLSDGAFSSSLSAYSTTVTVNSSTAAYTINSDGRAEVPSLFSDVAIFSTTDTLTGIGIGVVAPDGGSVLIEGADNATITLIVVNNVQVTLEVDVDGDGAVDDTQFTTWDELGALL